MIRFETADGEVLGELNTIPSSEILYEGIVEAGIYRIVAEAKSAVVSDEYPASVRFSASVFAYAIPEPATWLSGTMGLVAFVCIARRKMLRAFSTRAGRSLLLAAILLCVGTQARAAIVPISQTRYVRATVMDGEEPITVEEYADDYEVFNKEVTAMSPTVLRMAKARQISRIDLDFVDGLVQVFGYVESDFDELVASASSYFEFVFLVPEPMYLIVGGSLFFSPVNATGEIRFESATSGTLLELQYPQSGFAETFGDIVEPGEYRLIVAAEAVSPATFAWLEYDALIIAIVIPEPASSTLGIFAAAAVACLTWHRHARQRKHLGS